MVHIKTASHLNSLNSMLLTLTISMMVATNLVSGQLDREPLETSSNVLIWPQQDYSGVKTYVSAYNDEGSDHELGEQNYQPITNIGSLPLSGNLESKFSNQRASVPESKNNFEYSATLYDLINRTHRPNHQMTTTEAPPDRLGVTSINQWTHSATTTARPTYDQIPRPMLYEEDDDDSDTSRKWTTSNK